MQSLALKSKSIGPQPLTISPCCKRLQQGFFLSPSTAELLSYRRFFMRTRRKPKPTFGVCRDCHLRQEVPRINWIHASAPRCSACGGMLDRSKVQRQKRKSKGNNRRKTGPTNKPFEQSTRLGNRTGSAKKQDRTRQRPGTDVNQPGRMEPKSAHVQPQSKLLRAGETVERPNA